MEEDVERRGDQGKYPPKILPIYYWIRSMYVAVISSEETEIDVDLKTTLLCLVDKSKTVSMHFMNCIEA
jgi:hypothetical protein